MPVGVAGERANEKACRSQGERPGHPPLARHVARGALLHRHEPRQAGVGDLPEELLFHVNYLGGNMPTFTLNFSRPGNQLVGQYYNFVRLGFSADLADLFIRHLTAAVTDLERSGYPAGDLEETPFART